MGKGEGRTRNNKKKSKKKKDKRGLGDKNEDRRRYNIGEGNIPHEIRRRKKEEIKTA